VNSFAHGHFSNVPAHITPSRHPFFGEQAPHRTPVFQAGVLTPAGKTVFVNFQGWNISFSFQGSWSIVAVSVLAATFI